MAQAGAIFNGEFWRNVIWAVKSWSILRPYPWTQERDFAKWAWNTCKVY